MMFGVLKFDTDDSELVSVIANESVKCYQRNSCDLCRASKLQCHGDEDICNRCAASLSPCTYTLSSGTSAGRKRLRKTSAAYPGVRSNKKCISDPRLLGPPEPENIIFSDPDLLWSASPGSDFLTGNDFTFTPNSGYGSTAPTPETPPTPARSNPLTQRICIAEDNAVESNWLIGPLHQETGQKRCDCLPSILRVLEQTGVRIAAGNETLADDMSHCLQQGIQHCESILSCTECHTRAESSILLATVANQLATVTGEIVNRFLQSQTSQDMFRFGRYVVNHAMQTRLMRSFVAALVEDMQNLLGHIKVSVGDKKGLLAMLEEGEKKVERMEVFITNWSS